MRWFCLIVYMIEPSISIIYATNLKALLSIPQSRLPVQNFYEMVEFMHQGRLKLLETHYNLHHSIGYKILNETIEQDDIKTLWSALEQFPPIEPESDIFICELEGHADRLIIAIPLEFLSAGSQCPDMVTDTEVMLMPFPFYQVRSLALVMHT